MSNNKDSFFIYFNKDGTSDIYLLKEEPFNITSNFIKLNDKNQYTGKSAFFIDSSTKDGYGNKTRDLLLKFANDNSIKYFEEKS
jgi:hypothetical protein